MIKRRFVELPDIQRDLLEARMDDWTTMSFLLFSEEADKRNKEQHGT